MTSAGLFVTALGPAAARTSRYGGTLTVALSGEPDTLDPTVSRGTGINIYPAMCQTLYQLVSNHGELELAPLLAASLPALSANKLTYTVQLRQGIQFNDGTPFNAQAVVTTVQRFMTYPGSSRAGDYADVASVAATGPYTVQFHLKARDSTFVGTSNYVLSPTALATEGVNFGAHPVCVGPFMFDHWTAGSSITLVKSPFYYGRNNVFLDKVVYDFIPDAASAVAALMAGDLQGIFAVDPIEVAAVQQDASLRMLESPELGWRGVVFNLANRSLPFVSSPLLRQAFEEAIDRQVLNRVVFAGLYHPSCTPIPPANTEWYDAIKVPCTPYDPVDARRLVARSGIANPTVDLLTRNSSDRLAVAQFIQAEEAAVGINVEIDSVDAPTETARLLAGNFEADITTGLEPGSVEPSTLLYQFFMTGGARNYGDYSNPRMDYVLTNGLRATALPARAVNYRVAQQIVAKDRPDLVLFNMSTLAAFSTTVKGTWLSANGTVHIENAQYG
jgi:peptide/nickel transport system substrate-binding protein